MTQNDGEIDTGAQEGSFDSVGAHVGDMTNLPNDTRVNKIMGNGVTDNYNNALTENAFELSIQNAYLKAQFDGLKHQMLDSVETCQEIETNCEGRDFEQVTQLKEEIRILKIEMYAQKETQKAAEDALEHLRTSYIDADTKVQDLSTKLVEAQQKMEKEIKERDDKYADLDSKFGRLHKRAKQRIQDIQKEKDELEARLHDVNEIAEKTSTQQTSIQKELERTRQQANEALRSMDAERQQLRTTNTKLRDNIDEMHRVLESKDNALEGMRQSLFEKEKVLEETRRLLQAAEERKQTSVAELTSKHQKDVESLEAQLSDLLSERSKTTETVASLQKLVNEKDSRIAELEAASSGETVRLGAAIEAAKAEITQLKQEHINEKQGWNENFQALKNKLEASENSCLRSEIEAAKLRSQFELELSAQNQLLNEKDSALFAAKEEINRLESEFSAYKIRAHTLLQKKEAELNAAKDTDVVKGLEEAIKETEREATLALLERDKALQELQSAVLNHDKEIAGRDSALCDMEHQVKELTSKLDSLSAKYVSDKETWNIDIQKIEEAWRLKYNMLESEKNDTHGKDMHEKFEILMLQHRKLKEEHDSFRDIADRMLEEKEKEINKITEENKVLRQNLQTRAVSPNGNANTAYAKQDNSGLSIAAAEQQILLLARQQAQREEELAQTQRYILALQEEIEELERENRLRSQQEAMLKDELRNMERKQKREGVDMTYLKNVILKLLETGEVEVLLPVVGTLLQFSPEEFKKCQQVYRSNP